MAQHAMHVPHEASGDSASSTAPNNAGKRCRPAVFDEWLRRPLCQRSRVELLSRGNLSIFDPAVHFFSNTSHRCGGILAFIFCGKFGQTTARGLAAPCSRRAFKLGKKVFNPASQGLIPAVKIFHASNLLCSDDIVWRSQA